MTGFVFFFPGLYVEEKSPEAALAAVPEAVGAELEWLAARGVVLAQRHEPVETWEVERIDLASDVSRGRWVGAFRYERRPTTDADVELALERTELVRLASRELLDRLEAARAMHQETAAGAANETLAAAEAMLTVRAAEIVGLLTCLGTRPQGELAGGPRQGWEAASHMAKERLRALLPGDRERHAVFDGEEWTTRKVLRVLAVGERNLHLRLAALAEAPVPFSFGGSSALRYSPR